MTPRPRRLTGFRLVLFGAFALGALAHAQPALEVRRVTHLPPLVEAAFSVTCGGGLVPVEARQLHLFDNGIPVDSFMLSCPDPARRCAMSVALVFDASTSMAGPPIDAVKSAGRAFLGRMDGATDQAAVVRFNAFVTVTQAMTADTARLRHAIDSLTASGATALWDGIHAGVVETMLRGVNSCRAVIALTDGGNNSSSRTPAEIIDLAQRMRIRIFPISLRATANGPQLRSIAEQTGGRYVETPDLAQLDSLFRAIAATALAGFEECIVSFPAFCADGDARTLTLAVSDVCGGTDSGSRTYTTARDSSTYRPLIIGVSTDTVRGKQTIQLPIVLKTPLASRREFHETVIAVLYDTSRVRFVTATAPAGTLLEGVPLYVTSEKGRIVVRTLQEKLVHGYGPLFLLTFETQRGPDTSWCPVRIAEWNFDGGCFFPVTQAGGILTLPGGPELTCSLDAPDLLDWSSAAGTYDPETFTVAARMTNTGDEAVEGTVFRLAIDTAAFQLVYPATLALPGNPTRIDPGHSSTAAWTIRARPRAHGDSLTLCVVASFDRHSDVSCCASVLVPRAETPLACSLSMPVLAVDTTRRGYVPDPFEITATLVNEGSRSMDSIFAEIEAPAGFSFAQPDSGGTRRKPLTPMQLLPGQAGVARWSLTHRPSRWEFTAVCRVRAKNNSGDSTQCEYPMLLPAVPLPALVLECNAPDSLEYDNATASYRTRPFEVSATCRNIGSSDALSVVARLMLPEGMELADATEPLTKAYHPLRIRPFVSGDTLPRVSWQVRYTSKAAMYAIRAIAVAAWETDPAIVATDTARSFCAVIIPAVTTSYECLDGASVSNPDSLVRNPRQTGVQPNPFHWRSVVRNTGRHSGIVEEVGIAFPAEGLALDPSTPPTVFPHRVLAPGDSLVFDWIFHVENLFTPRVARMEVRTRDDLSVATSCSRDLPIAAVVPAMLCDLTGVARITFDRRRRVFDPSPFRIRANVTNTGEATLKNVRCALSWDAPLGVNLIEFDPDWPDNRNPKVLSSLEPGGSHEFLWSVVVAHSNNRDTSTIVRFTLNYGADAMSDRSDCHVDSEIEPGILLDAGGEPFASDGFYLAPAYPNPASPMTAITFYLPVASPVRLSIVDVLGRETALLLDGRRGPGWERIQFDAGRVAPGMYFCRLQTGTALLARRIVVAR